MMQHKHLLKKYSIPSLLFIGGCILGFLFLLYIHTTFQIHTLEMNGENKEKQKILTTALSGLSTLTTPVSEIKKMIHMRYPTMIIKEIYIRFPSILVLVVEMERPFAYLQTDYGYLELTKTGVVVAKERSATIPNPSVSFYQTIHHSEYQIGQQIGFMAVGKALFFISLLEDEGYKTETVAIDSVDMIACKTKGFTIAFSQSRPTDLQAHETRQIIGQIKTGALRIERLDLRFDKPVVQLPKK